MLYPPSPQRSVAPRRSPPVPSHTHRPHLVQVYFKGGALEVGLKDLKGKKRAFIVTDKPLFDMGYADKVTNILDQINIQHQV